MINKKLLSEVVETQDLLSIERHLLYSYLSNNNLDFSKSKLLSDYFNNFEKIPKLLFDTSSLNINTIKELENYLELIIPLSDRKFNGAFFTPDYIIDFIINEIKQKKMKRILIRVVVVGPFW